MIAENSGVRPVPYSHDPPAGGEFWCGIPRGATKIKLIWSMNERREQNIEPQKEKESGIRLEEFDRIFRERPKLNEEIKKVFSVSLRCALASDFEGRHVAFGRRFEPYRTHPDDHLSIRSFEEFVSPPPSFDPKRKTWQTDREAILGADAQKRSLAEMIFKVRDAIPGEQTSIWASLVYSTDKETAKRYWGQGQFLGGFAAPKELQFHGIFIGQPLQEKRVSLAHAAEHPKFSSLTIDRTLVKNLLEWLDRPTEECAGSVAEIERLGKELGFDAEKIEMLKQTVRDFATYVKPEPTTNEQCFAEIGRCFTAPHTFEYFAREWHGLKVDTDFYEHSYGGHATFFHQVNVVDGKMVIDWTARQYREFDEEPYPFVYRVGDERVRFGPLRGLEMEKKRQNKRRDQE